MLERWKFLPRFLCVQMAELLFSEVHKHTHMQATYVVTRTCIFAIKLISMSWTCHNPIY